MTREELKRLASQKEETWLPVKGYEGLYEVSNMGRVYSIKTKKVLVPLKALPSIKYRKFKKISPYLKVGLYKENKKKNKKLHRLVAEAFIENPDNKPYVNHINEIKTDCTAFNLEWVTESENVNHSNNIRKKEEMKIQEVIRQEENGQLLLPFHPCFFGNDEVKEKESSEVQKDQEVLESV